jgi:hypothetical protein
MHPGFKTVVHLADLEPLSTCREIYNGSSLAPIHVGHNGHQKKLLSSRMPFAATEELQYAVVSA